jgi:16S rRNA (guanine966-N2)-methyltransferase
MKHMRISGGEAGGRRIKPPKHKGLRPTSDKVREALFSILQNRIGGASFLELFCGTGAVGIEALSRGAERAVLVDNSAKAARLVRENLDSLGYRDKAAVVSKDVIQFIKNTATGMGPFDIVFVDPPYHEEVGPKALELLGEVPGEGPDFLNEDAAVVYEHHKRYPAPETVGRLKKKKDYNYGDTVVSLYLV